MNSASLVLRHVGGPTVVLETAGVRLLTDPTFDPPGSYVTPDYTLTKTTGPAIGSAGIGAVDAVLLSHHQHADNLDRAGRALLEGMPLVLSTAAAADAIGPPVAALASWEDVEIAAPGGRVLRVTAVPAEHGPAELGDLTGPVTGFVLSGEGLATVYVSGDNASLDVVREVAARFPDVDVAVLFGGAARAERIGPVNLTLGAADLVTAAGILGARHVYPVHAEGWEHFSEGVEDIRVAFERAGLGDRLVIPSPGATPSALLAA